MSQQDKNICTIANRILIYQNTYLSDHVPIGIKGKLNDKLLNILSWNVNYEDQCILDTLQKDKNHKSTESISTKTFLDYAYTMKLNKNNDFHKLCIPPRSKYTDIGTSRNFKNRWYQFDNSNNDNNDNNYIDEFLYDKYKKYYLEKSKYSVELLEFLFNEHNINIVCLQECTQNFVQFYLNISFAKDWNIIIGSNNVYKDDKQFVLMVKKSLEVSIDVNNDLCDMNNKYVCYTIDKTLLLFNVHLSGKPCYDGLMEKIKGNIKKNVSVLMCGDFNISYFNFNTRAPRTLDAPKGKSIDIRPFELIYVPQKTVCHIFHKNFNGINTSVLKNVHNFEDENDYFTNCNRYDLTLKSQLTQLSTNSGQTLYTNSNISNENYPSPNTSVATVATLEQPYIDQFMWNQYMHAHMLSIHACNQFVSTTNHHHMVARNAGRKFKKNYTKNPKKEKETDPLTPDMIPIDRMYGYKKGGYREKYEELKNEYLSLKNIYEI